MDGVFMTRLLSYLFGAVGAAIIVTTVRALARRPK